MKNFIKIFTVILAVIMVFSMCLIATSCSDDASSEKTEAKDGVDGKDGTNGKDGASAYDIAVANGFTGTEAEWLESLKGADGRDGLDGKDGRDGADGKDGVDGKDGRDGADGASNVYVGKDGYIYIAGVNTGVKTVEPLNTTGVKLEEVTKIVDGKEVVDYFRFRFSAKEYTENESVRADVEALFGSVNIETNVTNEHKYTCFSNGKFVTAGDLRVIEVELSNSDKMAQPKVFDSASNELNGEMNPTNTNYTVKCAGKTGIQIQFEYVPAAAAIADDPATTDIDEKCDAIPALYSASDICISFRLWDVVAD